MPERPALERDGRREGRRRTFGPVVLLGLASAGLAAVAGNEPWAQGHGQAADRLAGMPLADEAGKVPAAGALGLVVLACWGVVLVTRGRVRRGVACLGVLGSIALAVIVATGWSSSVDGLRSDLSQVGTVGDVDHTAWVWLAAVATVVSLVATVLAVRWAPGWPEMGSRYDAPRGSRTAEPVEPAEPQDLAERSSLDLWKAMDEGRDPTTGPAE